MLQAAEPDRIAPKKMGWAGVVRMGAYGDNLIAASILRPLKALNYKIEVLSKLPGAVVFENNPFIDKLTIRTDVPETDAIATQTWFRSRAEEYDRFANLNLACEGTLALVELSAAFYWPPALRRQICGRSYLEFAHDIADLPYEFGPLFFPTEVERRDAVAKRNQISTTKKVVAWCISGTRVDKLYPPTPVVIAKLIRELDVQVVMVGAPAPSREALMAEQTQVNVRAQNGTDEGLTIGISATAADPTWSVRNVMAFLAVCDLVIGPDSGPMWSVAFEKVAKIMLHSHASVENITKHWINTISLHADQMRVPCWPCHRLHNSMRTCVPNAENSGSACISDVPVEAVMAAAAKLLDR